MIYGCTSGILTIHPGCRAPMHIKSNFSTLQHTHHVYMFCLPNCLQHDISSVITITPTTKYRRNNINKNSDTFAHGIQNVVQLLYKVHRQTRLHVKSYF